jgi:hypothetical protein
VQIGNLVLEYLKALAWPLIVLFIALAFREEFKKFLGRLQEVKGGGFGAVFSEGLQETQRVAEAAASETATDEPAAPAPTEASFDAIRAVATELPNAAVLAAWGVVEGRMLTAAQVAAPEELATGRPRTPITLIPVLERAGLNPMAVVALNNLRSLRNQAAHFSGPIEVATARDYVDTAELGANLLNTFISNVSTNQTV